MHLSYTGKKTILAILATVAALGEVFGGETRFTLMSYNVWKSWSQVDDGFRKGIESIRVASADVVGLQEASPELANRIAAELGWFRSVKSEGSAQIVSRFPIVESMAIDRLCGARIRIGEKPGREIVVFNCHLDYRFYGPYVAMKSGATAASVLQEEDQSERAAQMAEMLVFMKGQIAAADVRPVFLTGDFNCPSHLDWTAGTASMHGNVGQVKWPVTLSIIGAGMMDSFRVAHPDPVNEPGFTWSAIHKDGEPQDRIDFTYHKGGVEVAGSRVFTTNVEATVGPWGAGADIGAARKNTWPSDHSAVVTEYLIE